MGGCSSSTPSGSSSTGCSSSSSDSVSYDELQLLDPPLAELSVAVCKLGSSEPESDELDSSPDPELLLPESLGSGSSSDPGSLGGPSLVRPSFRGVVGSVTAGAAGSAD